MFPARRLFPPVFLRFRDHPGAGQKGRAAMGAGCHPPRLPEPRLHQTRGPYARTSGNARKMACFAALMRWPEVGTAQAGLFAAELLNWFTQAPRTRRGAKKEKAQGTVRNPGEGRDPARQTALPSLPPLTQGRKENTARRPGLLRRCAPRNDERAVFQNPAQAELVEAGLREPFGACRRRCAGRKARPARTWIASLLCSSQ